MSTEKVVLMLFGFGLLALCAATEISGKKLVFKSMKIKL
jgi:hypothetical protein